jgi:hypothetical protein
MGARRTAMVIDEHPLAGWLRFDSLVFVGAILGYTFPRTASIESVLHGY